MKNLEMAVSKSNSATSSSRSTRAKIAIQQVAVLDGSSLYLIGYIKGSSPTTAQIER